MAHAHIQQAILNGNYVNNLDELEGALRILRIVLDAQLVRVA